MQEQTITALCAALTAQQLPFAQGEPLAPHTTFKIGGPAAFWCTPRDAEQLRRTLQLCRENGVRVYLLGNGSNTLFDYAGFDGAVIDMRGLSGMENSGLDTDVVRITAGAGQTLGRLCSKAQTLVVVAAYWLHRVLGTWRGVTMAAPTEFDREKLLEFNKIYPMFDANRLVVKPNPVCVPNGPVTPWDERKRQFVFAGRLEELKGIRTVIEAWRILDKNAPELLVAGDGPLADWAKAQKLPKVRFLGQLPRNELHRIIGESRAVVGASLCYESFALVPAEAHALGTPVLASGIGNMGASVRPGFDGLCFAPGDAAALAGAVRAMSPMQFDCAAIAAATRRRFGEEENYKTLMRLYGRSAAEE